jgi:hypothetical protein
VVVEQGGLRVLGTAVPAYAVSAFAYDAATYTTTWTLAAPLRLDRVQLALAGVTDLTGAVPVADVTLPLNVVPGDADGNGRVDAFDTLAVRAKQGTGVATTTTSPSSYPAFHGVDGNGRIDAFDTLGVRAKQGTNLNQVPPAGAATPVAAAGFGAQPAAPDDPERDEVAALLA